MPMKRIDYAVARERVRPGDVVAFGGASWLSQIIKLSMGAPVSHTGVVLTALAANGAEPEFIESTIFVEDGQRKLGVTIRPFENAWESYEGEVWWLPMSRKARQRFKEARFEQFMREMKGMPFDLPNGAGVLLKELWDQLRDALVPTQEGQAFFAAASRDLQFFFCSELVAKGFEEAGVVPDVKENDVSPIDLCRWKMYENTYFQRRTDAKRTLIKGFNSRSPGSTLQAPT